MEAQEKHCAKVISKALVHYLRLTTSRTLIMTNIYMPGSPWESDVVKITKALHWTEYEIKVSRADFLADFEKRKNSYSPGAAKKHDVFQGLDENINNNYGTHRKIPIPKQFYFVTPRGLLTLEDIPSGYGLIEFNSEASSYRGGMSVTRVAAVNKNALLISSSDVFSIAVKASYKMRD